MKTHNYFILLDYTILSLKACNINGISRTDLSNYKSEILTLLLPIRTIMVFNPLC